MRKGFYLLGTLLFLALGAAIWMMAFRPYVRTNDALIDGFKSAVCPDITARITKLYVDEGDVVREGQLLCDLDDTILQSQKIEATANVETLELAVDLERYNFEKVRNDYERAQKGYQEGVITAQQLDHAQKNFGMAKSRFEKTEAELELARAELGVIIARLWHTKVYAPFNGMIVKRWMYVGDVPHPGQAIFSIYNLDTTWVVANLEETKMQNVKLGDPVEITLDIYPGRRFFGTIFVIKGSAASEFSLIPQDNATGNYTKVAQRVPLKISIERTEENKDLYFFPGLSAEVKIRVRT